VHGPLSFTTTALLHRPVHVSLVDAAARRAQKQWSAYLEIERPRATDAFLLPISPLCAGTARVHEPYRGDA